MSMIYRQPPQVSAFDEEDAEATRRDVADMAALGCMMPTRAWGNIDPENHPF